MNSKVSIGEVLSKAWQIVWKFKVLWIFGILAGCAGGNSSRFNFNGNSFSGNQNFGGGNGTGQLPPFFRQFQGLQPGAILQQFLAAYGAWIAVGVVLICVLWFVFYFLGTMGKIGLINGASQADAGATSLKFGQLWSESTPYFWRMFLLNLLVGLPFFLIIMALVVGMLVGVFAATGGSAQGAGLAGMMFGVIGLFICLMCVIVVVASLVYWILEQAQIAIVLENLGVLAAFRRGWQVFKSAWLTIILVAIIVGVITGIIGFIVALPMIGGIIALVGVLGFGAYTTSGFANGIKDLIVPLIIGGCLFLAYLPVLLTVSGALQAYIQSVQTLVFRRLTIEPAQPAPAADIVPDVEALR